MKTQLLRLNSQNHHKKTKETIVNWLYFWDEPKKTKIEISYVFKSHCPTDLTWLTLFFSTLHTNQSTQATRFITPTEHENKTRMIFFLKFPMKMHESSSSNLNHNCSNPNGKYNTNIISVSSCIFFGGSSSSKNWLYDLTGYAFFLLDHIFIRKFVNWVCAAVCTHACVILFCIIGI